MAEPVRAVILARAVAQANPAQSMKALTQA